MIYVRDDDVLLPSSSWGSPFLRFKQIHEWILEVPEYVVHIPAILVTEIQGFPEAIAYIKEQTADGRMQPEIHGLEHIDYGKLSLHEVKDHLKQCTQFLLDAFDIHPTIWYTPWGANSPVLQEAATDLGLKLTDCSNINKLSGRYGMVQQLKDGHDPRKFLEEKEIFMHWWERGERLQRVLKAIKAGSWEAAHGPA